MSRKPLTECLPCPICGEENNPIKPCARRHESQSQIYTFRCPACLTRCFLTGGTYDRLVESDKIFTL